ncbi:LamG-like jellyroll fold domain-containing protein [uncultured Oceanicoccus sp.]|uniref:DUF7483 domain-containing protein n=1 Tax=uncultured Oceanicoccus sp. TaxID=1706381 RepID=UPI0030DBDE63
MPVFNNNILAGASGATGAAAGFQISRSLRFNSGDSAYLNRTPSSAGNRKTWTFSFWIKRCKIGSRQAIFTAGADGAEIIFNGADNLRFYYYQGGVGYVGDAKTQAVFRDTSAWMHVVVVYNSTNGTGSDRIKIYVNGVQQALTHTHTFPLNTQTDINNSSTAHNIGKYSAGNSQFGQFYLAEVHHVDGQALAPTDFGEYDDNNVWQPKKFTGSFSSYDQSETWSNGSVTTGSLNTGDGSSIAGCFDGSPAANTGIFTNTGAKIVYTFPSTIDYTSKVELFAFRGEGNPGNSYFDLGDVTPSTNYFSQLASPGWITVATGSGSFDAITNQDQQNNGGWAGIKVDGILLVDPSVSVTVNSFHLDFSDNSSDAALGTDSSGNSNTWTVNNLSVAGSAWNQSQTWSSSLSSSTGFRGSEPATNAFDGDTSSICSAVNNGVVTFTSPVTFASDSTIRVIVHGGDHTVTVNGGSDQTISAGSYQTVNFTNSSNSTFTMTFQRDASADTGIRAIEIGGNVLVDSGVVDPNAAGIDSLIDTPTDYEADSGNNGGNYATLNPLDRKSTVSLSNGNLDATTSTTGWAGVKGTIGVSSGKYYFEATANGSAANKVFFGICASSVKPDTSGYLQDDSTERAKGMLIFCDNGQYQLDGNSRVNYSSSMADGDVIAIAYDLDGNTVQFYKNGSALGSIDISSSPLASTTVVPLYIHYNTNTTYHLNFGQRPFAYTPPTGFLSLCTTNLPDPTIADGSTAFDAVAYAGTGAARSISLGFSPDLVWTKQRSGTEWHYLIDTVRGNTKALFSNETDDEYTTNAQVLTAFNSDGYSLGSDSAVNGSSDSYVGWAWDGGSSTASNTDGSLTSNVRANPSAGFSIVGYTGNGSAATIGHGLNAAPEMIIKKFRSATSSWDVYHASVGAGKRLVLNSTDAEASTNSYQNVNSTTFDVHAGNNDSGVTMIAYCFAPVAGFSAFGSYEGKGNATIKPYINVGFRPAFILIKATDISGKSWLIYDKARDGYNRNNDDLAPDLNNQENDVVGPANSIDIFSNGFQPISDNSRLNEDGATYLYACFAEHPFKTSRAR